MSDSTKHKKKESSIISSLTIVNMQGTKQFFIGTSYEGLMLDKILDETVDAEQIYVPIFRGYTKRNVLVFEVINAPIEISYSLEELK